VTAGVAAPKSREPKSAAAAKPAETAQKSVGIFGRPSGGPHCSGLDAGAERAPQMPNHKTTLSRHGQDELCPELRSCCHEGRSDTMSRLSGFRAICGPWPLLRVAGTSGWLDPHDHRPAPPTLALPLSVVESPTGGPNEKSPDHVVGAKVLNGNPEKRVISPDTQFLISATGCVHPTHASECPVGFFALKHFFHYFHSVACCPSAVEFFGYRRY